MDLMMFQFQSADTARAEWKEYLPPSSTSSPAMTYELLSIIPEIVETLKAQAIQDKERLAQQEKFRAQLAKKVKVRLEEAEKPKKKAKKKRKPRKRVKK